MKLSDHYWKLKILIPILYFLGSILLFFIFRIYIWNNFYFIQITGIVISVIAFLLWIISRIQLGESYSINPKASKLFTKGIYSKIRHPIYLFSTFALFGMFIFLGKLSLFFLVLIPVICLQIFRAKKEEKILLESFKQDYIEYKKTTWF